MHAHKIVNFGPIKKSLRSILSFGVMNEPTKFGNDKLSMHRH